MKSFEEDNDLISIIMPVYNVQNYISKTIESVLNQTYAKFELILIDDGSTDESINICRKFESIDKRIIVFSQKNKGVSAARNKGISKSRGTYIIFIDSDDWIAPNTLETYHNRIIQDNSDLLINEYNRDLGDNLLHPQEGDLPEGYITIEQALLKLINPKGCYGSVWGKIFRSEIIIENQLFFDTSISVAEDLLFTINYITYCSKISYSKNCLYNYVFRDNSALNTVNLKRLDVIKVYKELFEQKNFSERIRSRLKAMYAWECIDWQCRLGTKEYKKIKVTLKKEAILNLHYLLLSDTFTHKNKLNSLLKLSFPYFICKCKMKNENKNNRI